MSQTSKPMPVILKVLIGFLVLGLIYRMSVHQPRRDGQGSDYATPASSPVEERRSGGYDAAPQADSARQADGAGSQLAQYQAQYSQVLARINQCEAQNNAYAAQQLAAGANPITPPACNQYVPQWIAQGALLNTYITRLQTGNTRLTVCEANPGLTGCGSLEAAARSSSSHSASGDTSDDVENWSRQAILGHSHYTDETGHTHDLPTRDYYYRNRVSDQMVGSDSPTAPDYNHDWEQVHPDR
jgi:hypothetical protein